MIKISPKSSLSLLPSLKQTLLLRVSIQIEMTKPQPFGLRRKVNALLFLIVFSTPMPSCPRLDLYSFVNKQLLFPWNSDNLTSTVEFSSPQRFPSGGQLTQFPCFCFPGTPHLQYLFPPFHSSHFFQSHTSELVITVAPPLKLLILTFPFTTAS